jgi:predicted pyridoxine 5'-phosphate oxidase superfamily flavin-nucleotide-binding protein
MITEKMRRFIEEVNCAFVASADQNERPHLAVGKDLKVPDPHHVVFEAWFCHRTLENVGQNPYVALAVVDPATGAGYQLAGTVESTSQIGILDGFAPQMEAPGTPQVESRMVVKVHAIMEFSHGVHTDRPLSAET